MNILCFGDSNTWGANPAGGRWPREIRWTGRLQQMLGNGHYVIEDGLCGRTTAFEDPFTRCRSGLEVLPLSLEIHSPLDVVVLMLGTNDCQTPYAASPRIIARGAERLVETVAHFPYDIGCPVPKVLLVSPAHIGDEIENMAYAGFDRTSRDKSRVLAFQFAEVATRNGCLFLDAAMVMRPSRADQLHLDPEAHDSLAKALAGMIQTMAPFPAT